MKLKKVLITLLLTFGVVGLIYFFIPHAQNVKNDLDKKKTSTTTKQGYTINQSKDIAEDWIKNESPTYTFDGQKLNLKSKSELDISTCKDCYEFMFKFESTHGGYGDRSDKMVTQVITPHTMKVIVKNGRVVQAITDEKFDEMKGGPISSEL